MENHPLPLSDIEKDNAYFLANRMLLKHGYWAALYNVMTLMIWSRNRKVHWTEEETRDITFWFEVRNFIYKSR